MESKQEMDRNEQLEDEIENEEEENREEEMISAARFGELDDVRSLLDSGVDVNTRLFGNTALHMACANGHIDVVELLIERGAQLLYNENDSSPLDWAVINGHKIIVEKLLASYEDIDVKKKDFTGVSPLLQALRMENDEIISILLSHPTSGMEDFGEVGQNDEDSPSREDGDE